MSQRISSKLVLGTHPLTTMDFHNPCLVVAVDNLGVLENLQAHQRTCVIVDTDLDTQTITIDNRWFQGMRRSFNVGCSREDLRKAIHWTVDVLLAYHSDLNAGELCRILTHLKMVLTITYDNFEPMHNTLKELLGRVQKQNTLNKVLAKKRGKSSTVAPATPTDILNTAVIDVTTTTITTDNAIPLEHDVKFSKITKPLPQERTWKRQPRKKKKKNKKKNKKPPVQKTQQMCTTTMCQPCCIL